MSEIMPAGIFEGNPLYISNGTTEVVPAKINVRFLAKEFFKERKYHSKNF